MRPCSTVAPPAWAAAAKRAASRVLPTPASPASDDDAALRGPAVVQHGQLGLAADERALLQPLERRAGSGTGAPAAGADAAAGAGSRRQQALVERGDLRRRRRPELVAQQHAQLVVDAQRLGDVAARRERLHQRAVARLAVGLAPDQRARRPLGRRQLGRPEPQRRARERLERVRAQRLELGAALVDPAARAARAAAGARGDRAPRAPARPRAPGRPRRAPPPPRPPPRAPPRRRGRRRAARAAGRPGPRWRRPRARAAGASAARRCPASGAPGGLSSQTTSTSSSRRTARSRLSARYANSSRPWRPGRSPSTRRPSTSTVRAPHSSIRVGTGCRRTVTGRRCRAQTGAHDTPNTRAAASSRSSAAR